MRKSKVFLLLMPFFGLAVSNGYASTLSLRNRMDMILATATGLLLAAVGLAAYTAPNARAADLPAGLQEVAEIAASLAAERIRVEPAAVKVLVAEHVTWPNGALGCPRSGMNYTQALIAGYRIEIEAGGATLHYHGRSGGNPFFCASPGPRSGWIQNQ